MPGTSLVEVETGPRPASQSHSQSVIPPISPLPAPLLSEGLCWHIQGTQSCSSTHCTSTNSFTPKPAHLSLPRMLLHTFHWLQSLFLGTAAAEHRWQRGAPCAGVQFLLQEEDTPPLQPSAPASFMPCVPPRGINRNCDN